MNEDCQVCPEDCPCCAIIDSRGTLPELDGSNLPVATGAAGTAQDPTMAAGQPDGRSIVLDERSELTLAFGREVFDYFIPAEPERVLQHVDFTIHGEVTSTSSIDNASTCTRIGDEQQQGAFGVLASPDGITWSTIGIWARRPDGSQNNQFDIACAQLTQAKYVRIQAAPGATATLDAVTAVIDGTGRACWELAPQ